ncbi:hypothetical protein VUR80DRAFT_4692 [Thermomyces stellatus]
MRRKKRETLRRKGTFLCSNEGKGRGSVPEKKKLWNVRASEACGRYRYVHMQTQWGESRRFGCVCGAPGEGTPPPSTIPNVLSPRISRYPRAGPLGRWLEGIWFNGSFFFFWPAGVRLHRDRFLLRHRKRRKRRRRRVRYRGSPRRRGAGCRALCLFAGESTGCRGVWIFGAPGEIRKQVHGHMYLVGQGD